MSKKAHTLKPAFRSPDQADLPASTLPADSAPQTGNPGL
jgi:hypothetical protein